jgi:beta-N-acetylhexosaminidase
VRGTKLIAISTGIVLAVAAIIVFAAGAAARRAAPHHAGGVATTSGSVPASPNDGNGGHGGLTPVSAGIGLRRGAVSPSAAGIAAAKATLPKLTTLQLAGQRVIYSYQGRTPPARLLWLIRHGEVAGVIFFTDNIGTTAADLASFKKVVAELQAANRAATNPVRAPLLLMTDQEGGIVRRLPGPPTLSEKKIGASANPVGRATTAGHNAASYLRGFGINVNLAPVLDVYRTAGNFIDEFGRSYSSDPAIAAKAGAAFITAQQAGKVAATSKHFPGLGAAATSQNTDERPVTLHLTLSQLRSVDEVPYTSAITAGTKLVMASWATYPALDAKFPAGLSPTIVQGELRQRLGFGGVTITDALEANGLKHFGTTANRATLAAKAGMDLLLCAAEQYQQGDAAMHALQTYYNGTPSAQAAFKAAAERVIALRETLAG